MAVDVIIRRKFKKEQAEELAPLIVKLRSLATVQPGYISGETLKCIDPPGQFEFLVISIWQSAEDWHNWLQSDARNVIQKEIDDLTGGTTDYRIYDSLVGGIIPKLNG